MITSWNVTKVKNAFSNRNK